MIFKRFLRVRLRHKLKKILFGTSEISGEFRGKFQDKDTLKNDII